MSRYTTMTIGTMTTSEPTEVTELYETASWSKVVTVPAGTYDVVACASYGDGRPNVGHSLYVKMKGEITGGSMRDRFGSQHSKHDSMAERYGETSEVSRSMNPYFEVREGVTPHDVDVLLADWRGDRTIVRSVVDVSDLILPEGMTLDADAIEVAYVFESGGRVLASVKPRRDAYTAAHKAQRAA